MKILIFDAKWIEPAELLRIRTGLEIEKDDWKPEPKKAYIIFGGREVVDILIHAQREFDLFYIFMTPEEIYAKDLLKTGLSFTCDLEAIEKYKEKGIEADYGIKEYFYNKSTEPRNTRYLFHEWYENKSVAEKTKAFLDAKIYIAPSNDWDNIHKALACGCRVKTRKCNPAYETMYSPFVYFSDDDDWEDDDLPEPDYKKFLETVITYSLNKMLPLIKNVFIATEGERKEQKVMVSTGESEDGRAFVDIKPKEEAHAAGGGV